jgi:hypothetical protein
VQRDPVGYEDGMGQYEYVGGSPCCYLDPSGFAEVVITVLPGYYKKELGNPGQTRWASRVTGVCECPKTKWKLTNAKAEIQIAVTVDTRRVQQNQIAGVIGHEQKHVRQVQAAMNGLKPTIQARLDKSEKIDYDSKDNCTAELNKARTETEADISKAAQNAVKHAGPTATEEEEKVNPKAGKGYEPEPGSDTSIKGKPNPANKTTETFLPWEPQEKGEVPWQTNPKDPTSPIRGHLPGT